MFCSLAGAATVKGQVTLVAGHEEGLAVVVWLSPLAPQPADITSAHPSPVRMIQKNKHFEPHILAIEVGTAVDFPNLDPIFHNAFSNFDGQLFDVGLYPPGSSRTIHFRRQGLVRVFCNIHPAMSAVIVVLATPYFITTDQDGRFTLLNVPPGQYTLHFFHERATPETLAALTRTVTITNPLTTLPEVKISEAGYIPTPHKNKYGRDYPDEKSPAYHP